MTLLYDSGALGADTATIDTGAGGIASGYKVLEIWMLLRTDEAVFASTIKMTLNNDGSSIYDRQYLDAETTSVAGNATIAQAAMLFGAAGASVTANYFTVCRFTLPFYTDTTAYKTIEGVGSGNTNTTTVNQGMQQLHEVFTYRSTSAISRLAITPNTAGKKFKAGSRVVIYGTP